MRSLLAALACALPLVAAEPLLFDTDPGYFNDDCQALVMLLRSPAAATVEAVTVVAGNVWTAEGMENAARTLRAAGTPRVRVFAGAQAPLLHTQAMAEIEAARWGPLEFRGAFAGPFRAATAAPDAVARIIESIEGHPGRITFLALGPMTNLAMALRLRPEIAGKIGQLVFMGGNVRVAGNASRAAEFNFWFDPEAAAAVLRSAIPRKVMFGLDICNQAKLTRREFEQVVAVKTPVTELYREELGNRYPGFLKHPDATAFLWDALTAAWLADPSTVTASESMYLDVETRFGGRYGATIPLDRRLAPAATAVQVMTRLDFPKTFALYRSLLTR